MSPHQLASHGVAQLSYAVLYGALGLCLLWSLLGWHERRQQQLAAQRRRLRRAAERAIHGAGGARRSAAFDGSGPAARYPRAPLGHTGQSFRGARPRINVVKIRARDRHCV